MKTGFILLFSILVFSFCQNENFTVSNQKRIKWKSLDTEEKVRAEIDKKIFSGSDFDTDYKILCAEKHEWISVQGDTTILFHSPFVPVRTLSWVSRKWMFVFHFKEKKLLNYSVEKGLLGP